MAELLEGKTLAVKIKKDLRYRIQRLSKEKGLTLKLASVQIGENPTSRVYLRAQKKTSEDLGIEYELYQLDKATSEKDSISLIRSLNQDSKITGIILQRPLPPHLDYNRLIKCISPYKDVEGLHPENMGALVLGEAKITPPTASAVMELIFQTGVKLYGKEVVIIGHSEIVGKPLSLLLLKEFATITVCHIATGQRGLVPEHVKRAEILIVAVGKPHLVKGEWIKKEAIVVDVGINKVKDKIIGDVEFEIAFERASFITPVPGGVGPLTVVLLMRNLLEAASLQTNLKSYES